MSLSVDLVFLVDTDGDIFIFVSQSEIILGTKIERFQLHAYIPKDLFAPELDVCIEFYLIHGPGKARNGLGTRCQILHIYSYTVDIETQ